MAARSGSTNSAVMDMKKVFTLLEMLWIVFQTSISCWLDLVSASACPP